MRIQFRTRDRRRWSAPVSLPLGSFCYSSGLMVPLVDLPPGLAFDLRRLGFSSECFEDHARVVYRFVRWENDGGDWWIVAL